MLLSLLTLFPDCAPSLPSPCCKAHRMASTSCSSFAGETERWVSGGELEVLSMSVRLLSRSCSKAREQLDVAKPFALLNYQSLRLHGRVALDRLRRVAALARQSAHSAGQKLPRTRSGRGSVCPSPPLNQALEGGPPLLGGCAIPVPEAKILRVIPTRFQSCVFMPW